MIDACPQTAHVITVSKPLNIGLPEAKFDAVINGRQTIIATQRNPRKDRYFCAKRPLQARIASLETGRSVLRDIISIEGTPSEWKISI